MKIGVLTYHRAHNYGAYLQAFALTSYLRKIGYDCEIINYNLEKAEKLNQPKQDENYEQNKIKYEMFERSLKKLPLSNYQIIDDDIYDISDKIEKEYDIVIVGSDEVWKIDNVRGFPNIYWLPEKNKCKKIGYAISSRSDFSKLDEEDLKKIKEYINDFDYIGLRDDYSISHIEGYCYRNDKIHLNCDPTFLYDFGASKENGFKILKEKYKIDSSKKNIAIMTNNKILVKLICAIFGKKANILSIYYAHKGTINTLDADPFEVLNIIKSSDLIISSFFHGTCFALQNNTKFIADDFRDKTKEQSKIYDLLKRVNMLDHFVSKHDPLYILKMISKCKKIINDKEPDYTEIVRGQRENSKSFLDYLAKITGEQNNEENN